ncbi:hypothetical protein QYE76_070188 [Lolium multiflorum]|uniref:Peptidase A1 domain-containing protein n=1 Tax=Lolium multiflorum TaxID=4521 RepID=A0AAD8WDP6_LOLMU|nr:hypothetical protein QYE76_070188 [Lolium multiflorum]
MPLRRSSAALAALLAVSVLLGSAPCTTVADDHKPIVARVSKDATTSLYTIANKVGGVPLLLDLAGPLLWLANCPSPHRTFPCDIGVCKVANWNHPPNCPYTPTTECSKGAACTAYTYNPVNGRCGHDDATTITLVANATDGKNPLFPVSFRAVGSCAPGELLASLPAGAAGVAGLSRLPLSLPWQVGYRLGVPKQFALCLPGGSGSDGVAVFGGGPFQLLGSPPVELAAGILQNQLPLLRNPKINNGAYYFQITGIAVNEHKVPTALGAFDIDSHAGTGGAVFSTVTPYTALRPDIYRPLHDAFDAAPSGIARAPPMAPFDMCYEASTLGVTRLGYAVPNIDLMLDGGRNWTLFGGSSLVQVNEHTVCFAIVEMEPSMPAAANSPAVIIGGFQMKEHLLMFDLEKGTFGFSGPLSGIRTGCSNFNFTMGST